MGFVRRLFLAVTPAFVGALAMSAEAEAKSPWEELMGTGTPRLWTDPAGRFALDLPVGWTAQKTHENTVVRFEMRPSEHGLVARATIQVLSVPSGIELSHFAVRVADEMKRSTYRYRPIAREMRSISGQPAVLHRFTHQERGHTALSNEVQQAIFIVKERAFVVTIEAPAGSRPAFQEDIDKMLANFVGYAPGDEARARAKMPKRVNAGRLVDPDSIRY